MLELAGELLELFGGHPRKADDTAKQATNVVAFLHGELDGVLFAIEHPPQDFLLVCPRSLTLRELFFRNRVAPTMFGD